MGGIGQLARAQRVPVRVAVVGQDTGVADAERRVLHRREEVVPRHRGPVCGRRWTALALQSLELGGKHCLNLCVSRLIREVRELIRVGSKVVQLSLAGR